MGIDFLPSGYHRRRQRRQRRYWHWGVFAAFLGLCTLGGVGQRRAVRALEAQRDRMQQQLEIAVGKLESADALRRRVERLEAGANLVTHLRAAPRPTRLLAAVTQSVPPFITLTELRTTREPVAARPSSRSGTKKAKTAREEPADRCPAAIDLERLREQERTTARFLHLLGTAPDDLTVSQYLAALHGTGFFDDAQLLYTDQHVVGEHRLRKFEIRLRVRKPRAEVL